MDSNQGNKGENETEKNIDCKGCGISLTGRSVLRHIFQHRNVSCKTSYTEMEILTLKEEAKSRKKLVIKQWKKDNPGRVSDHNIEWYSSYSDSYNEHRRKMYKEKNMSEQRAKKYQEDKRKAIEEDFQYRVLKAKEELVESFILKEDRFKSDFRIKALKEEKKEIDKLKSSNLGKDVDEKLTNLKIEIDEKASTMMAEFQEMVELVKKEMGPEEGWKYEEELINSDFISRMHENFIKHINCDRQLFRYYIYESIQEITEATGHKVNYKVFEDADAAWTRKECFDSDLNYYEIKDKMIQLYRRKSGRIRFVIHNHRTKYPICLQSDQPEVKEKPAPKLLALKNKTNIRKRKKIDFNIEDLENEKNNDDQEFISNARPSLISRLMPKRLCKLSK